MGESTIHAPPWSYLKEEKTRPTKNAGGGEKRRGKKGRPGTQEAPLGKLGKLKSEQTPEILDGSTYTQKNFTRRAGRGKKGVEKKYPSSGGGLYFKNKKKKTENNWGNLRPDNRARGGRGKVKEKGRRSRHQKKIRHVVGSCRRQLFKNKKKTQGKIGSAKRGTSETKRARRELKRETESWAKFGVVDLPNPPQKKR